jgi:hypothetical protein
MIHEIQTSKVNVLAFEVVDNFAEEDEKQFETLFQKRLDLGYHQINVLVKLDELKLSHIHAKAFMEDMIWLMRNYKKMGHLAIVAHSKIIKAMVPIDKLFFERASEGRLERYFDVSQMDDALAFVLANKVKLKPVAQ